MIIAIKALGYKQNKKLHNEKEPIYQHGCLIVSRNFHNSLNNT